MRTPENQQTLVNQILLVDDSMLCRAMIKDELAEQERSIIEAENGKDALEMTTRFNPDLILLDIHMPGESGLDILETLQENPATRSIPVIMLTGQGNESLAVEAMKRGAKDYLVKGQVTKENLEHAITNAIQKCSLERELARQQAELERLARTDPLTGLLNRRSFFTQFETRLEQGTSGTHPLACVLLDLDFFKRINDDRGHGVGDIALKKTSELLQACLPSSGLACRYGGEEICILLPDFSESEANTWADKTRATLSQLDIPDGDSMFHLTASFGVAERPESPATPDKMTDWADQALACAKGSGRNCVISYSQLAETESLKTLDRNLLKHRLHDVPIKDVMITSLFSLSENDSLQKAAEILSQLRINVITVVDGQGRLVGVLSEKDLMVAFASAGSADRPTREIMTTHVVQYGEEEPAISVFEFFCRNSLRRVVIVKEGRPVGVVSRSALLRWISNWKKCNDGPAQGAPREASIPTPAPANIPLIGVTEELLSEIEQLRTSLTQQGSDLNCGMIHTASKLQTLAADLLTGVSCVQAGGHQAMGAQGLGLG